MIFKYSIIICSYNRFKLLVETIDSILKVTSSREDFEIIIIDNNSPDETSTLKETYLDNDKVKYFLETEQGLSHARNRGMMEASGEILVYLDDDVELVENYFEVCDAIFLDSSISIAGGKVLPFKVDIPSWLPEKYYYLVSVFDLGNNIKFVDALMGANYAMRKKLASEVGLYNTELGRKGSNLMGGEEIDYLNRAKNKGYGVLYNPDMIVFHKINEKLNLGYVFNYSKQLGKSERIIDKSISKRKVFFKILKSNFAKLVYKLVYKNIKNEKKKTLLGIVNEYAKGYIEN